MVPAADISTVIVDKPQKAQLLLEHVEKKTIPGLKMIILMDPFEEALKDRGQACGVVIKSMQAVEVRAASVRAVCWAVCWASVGLPTPLRPCAVATEPNSALGPWVLHLATKPELPIICPSGRCHGLSGHVRVETEQAARGWWWLVWSVPTGILWETGSVAGTVNDTGASRGVVVSASPFPASHSHSLPEPEA